MEAEGGGGVRGAGPTLSAVRLCVWSPYRGLLRSQAGHRLVSGGARNLKEATSGLEQAGGCREMARVWGPLSLRQI